MAAQMPSNLLLYEKDNNLLLKALRVLLRLTRQPCLTLLLHAQENPEYTKILDRAVDMVIRH